MKGKTVEITLTINDDENLLLAQVLSRRMKELALQPQTAKRDREMITIRSLIQKLLPPTRQMAAIERQHT